MIYKLSLLPDGTITGYQMVSERDRECGPDEVQGNPGPIADSNGKLIKRLIDNPDHGKVIGTREINVKLVEDAMSETGYAKDADLEDILDTRRRIIVPREPDPPTPEEIAREHDRAVVRGIRAAYTQDEEFRLINRGITDPKDAEYLRYRVKVEDIKKGTP